ncbi:MAG: type II toxin-antitoxin system RelE/ParE family toxin [Candidatus Peregrinibacteria bacterium]
MEEWKKQLRKMPYSSRQRVMAALLLLQSRDFGSLDRRQLKGYEHIYRIRIGNYRVIYFDDGARIIFRAIRRRNEATYRDF